MEVKSVMDKVHLWHWTWMIAIARHPFLISLTKYKSTHYIWSHKTVLVKKDKCISVKCFHIATNKIHNHRKTNTLLYLCLLLGQSMVISNVTLQNLLDNQFRTALHNCVYPFLSWYSLEHIKFPHFMHLCAQCHNKTKFCNTTPEYNSSSWILFTYHIKQ